MGYLRHIRACNCYQSEQYADFLIEGQCVGKLAPEFQKFLSDFPSLFTKVFHKGRDAFILNDALVTPFERTHAMADFMPVLVSNGFIRKIRNELYKVVCGGWYSPELMQIDRGAMVLFGFHAFGVHMNGSVETSSGSDLWIAKRSMDKALAPGKLDNVVAGGQPAGLGLFENLIKEAGEEAGLPSGLVKKARSAGAITYVTELPGEGLRRDTLFIYDLIFPLDVVPYVVDGEVDSFFRMHVLEALERVRTTDDFKFNVSLVLIDYGIRHGLITPDKEKDFEALACGLHARF